MNTNKVRTCPEFENEALERLIINRHNSAISYAKCKLMIW